jgi:hypothetical protein
VTFDAQIVVDVGGTDGEAQLVRVVRAVRIVTRRAHERQRVRSRDLGRGCDFLDVVRVRGHLVQEALRGVTADARGIGVSDGSRLHDAVRETRGVRLLPFIDERRVHAGMTLAAAVGGVGIRLDGGEGPIRG